MVSKGLSCIFFSRSCCWGGLRGMRLPSSADSTEAVMLAFVCFPATSLSRVYVNGSVAVIVVIVSLYPISIFPISLNISTAVKTIPKIQIVINVQNLTNTIGGLT